MLLQGRNGNPGPPGPPGARGLTVSLPHTVYVLYIMLLSYRVPLEQYQELLEPQDWPEIQGDQGSKDQKDHEDQKEKLYVQYFLVMMTRSLI